MQGSGRICVCFSDCDLFGHTNSTALALGANTTPTSWLYGLKTVEMYGSYPMRILWLAFNDKYLSWDFKGTCHAGLPNVSATRWEWLLEFSDISIQEMAKQYHEKLLILQGQKIYFAEVISHDADVIGVIE